MPGVDGIGTTHQAGPYDPDGATESRWSFGLTVHGGNGDIKTWGAGRHNLNLARASAPRGAKKAVVLPRLPFTIRSLPDNNILCTVQPTGPESYQVSGPDGFPLATITRRPGRFWPWPWPRRIRWTLTPAAPGAPTYTGRVGSWYTWLVYVVFAPLWIPCYAAIVVSMILSSGGGDMPDGPTRTRWRAPGHGTALEYRGVNKVYHLDPRRLDHRVAYAQAVLHDWDR
ncbi:hypothetical protein [Plantactinospora sp. B5E13]|uniref:hypothetical protein n=1 Tax=Plantactinospora sp. B5E13 TaxID=3153758 RepID=UPI00325EEA5D